MKNITYFLLRLLALPFWMGLSLISYARHYFLHCYYFLRYGGECIAYVNEMFNHATVTKTYIILREILKEVQSRPLISGEELADVIEKTWKHQITKTDENH